MTHAGQELTLQLGGPFHFAVAKFQLAVLPLDLLLRLLALSDVTGDLRKPPQCAALITKRGNDHVRPEARSILAQAPAFLLIAAFCIAS